MATPLQRPLSHPNDCLILQRLVLPVVTGGHRVLRQCALASLGQRSRVESLNISIRNGQDQQLMAPKKHSRREQCRPERRSVRSINVCGRIDFAPLPRPLREETEASGRPGAARQGQRPVCSFPLAPDNLFRDLTGFSVEPCHRYVRNAPSGSCPRGGGPHRPPDLAMR